MKRVSRAAERTLSTQSLESESLSADGGDRAARSTAVNMLSLVEKLASTERIGVTALARIAGIPVATTYRMLRILEQTGYVEQLETSKEYRLTLKLFSLGCEVASKTTIRDLAVVELAKLAEQTGMTTNLGVLVGTDLLYLSKVESGDLFTLNQPPGSRSPATCTAMGKAMLAFDTRPVASIVGKGPYVCRTEYSICTLEELKKDLTETKRRGYSIDRQEFALGVYSVGAPITGGRYGQQGAISVSAVRPGMRETECRQLGEIVKSVASEISARIPNGGQLGILGEWIR